MKKLIFSLALLGGCNITSQAEAPEQDTLDWFTGCWQSMDGTTREVWSSSEDGYLFGYSVVLNEGSVVFFEQMRIDPGTPPVFNAYPRGQGPSGFPAVSASVSSITFANPAHDYPQKIKYARDGDALKAVISLMDDTRQGHFDFVACPPN